MCETESHMLIVSTACASKQEVLQHVQWSLFETDWGVSELTNRSDYRLGALSVAWERGTPAPSFCDCCLVKFQLWPRMSPGWSTMAQADCGDKDSSIISYLQSCSGDTHPAGHLISKIQTMELRKQPPPGFSLGTDCAQDTGGLEESCDLLSRPLDCKYGPCGASEHLSKVDTQSSDNEMSFSLKSSFRHVFSSQVCGSHAYTGSETTSQAVLRTKWCTN